VKCCDKKASKQFLTKNNFSEFIRGGVISAYILWCFWVQAETNVHVN